MLIKDYKVKNTKEVYKASRKLNAILESDDRNGVEDMVDILSSLTKEDIIEYAIHRAGYEMNKDNYKDNKIGRKFHKYRYDIEEIYHGNATAYYVGEKEEEATIRIDSLHGKLEKKYFYYYGDCGTIYRSYVETLVDVSNKNNSELKTYASDVMPKNDEVMVEVVGKIPTHTNKMDLVFGIM